MNESTVVNEIDNEMFKANGVMPQEDDLGKRFKETQEYIKKAFGGGEDNELDKAYIDGLRQRKEAIEHRLLDRLGGEEVEEIEEAEEYFEIPEAIDYEIPELMSYEEELNNDGIYMKK